MRGFVIKRSASPEELSPWAKYLIAAQSRPGLKGGMAEIERQLKANGTPISKATLFRMMADKVPHVSTQWVLAIAAVLGDEPQVALQAAGDQPGRAEQPGDPRLSALGLLPSDPTVQKILRAPFDYGLQTEMLEKLSARRAEQRELQLRQEAAEVEQNEQIWRTQQKKRQRRPSARQG